MSLKQASREVAADEQVVLRIVVYGPASAGKTTTARALGQNLGRRIETPEEEEDGTTVFFDWMEYEGGTFEGSSVKVQLITVPGHDRTRRLALLDVADVVIFVADSTEAVIDRSTEYFHEMIDELIAIKNDPAVIVQANKRDSSTAVDIDIVRARFGMENNGPLVETVATESNGVRLVFVLAMRHGLERHAARIARGDVASFLDPDALLEALRALESSAPPSRSAPAETTAPPEAKTVLIPNRPTAPPAREQMPPPPTPADAVVPDEAAIDTSGSLLRRIFGRP